MKTKIFTLLTVLAMSTITIGQIINVPEDQPTIQAGINAANIGDTVLVAQDTYYENINFLGKAITIASNYLIDPDSSHILNTIIDGGQPANPDSASVVYFISGEDTTSILCGFTIQNGSGTYPDGWGDHAGGGILCEFSGAKIIHNRIINNTVSNNASIVLGAGVAASSEENHTLIMRDNIIADNELNTLGYNASGGGIFIWSLDNWGINHTIQNNIIKNNSAIGKKARGAGLSTNRCVGIVSNNEIRNNEADVTLGTGLGAGIHVRDPGPGLTITQNTIIGNIYTGDGNYYGGGIGVLNYGDYSDYYIDGNIIANNNAKWGGGILLTATESGCFITNNVIRDNQADERGGGICCFNSSGEDEMQSQSVKRTNSMKFTGSGKKGTVPQIINNTIINNTAGTSGGGIYNGYEDNDIVVFNNIIYGNNAGQGAAVFAENIASNTYLYYNDIDPDMIHGTWSGTNNIFVDPQFDEDGYHLLVSSECIEAGITTLEINDDTYYCPEFDIDGQLRPLNSTADIGVDEVLITGIHESILTGNGLSLQNSPNPFKRYTSILFEIKSDCYADLSIYDLSGKKIQTLVNENKQAGIHELKLNVSWLDNGIYFCVLKTSEGVQTAKMIKLD